MGVASLSPTRNRTHFRFCTEGREFQDLPLESEVEFMAFGVHY